jgi:hypothetical protein
VEQALAILAVAKVAKVVVASRLVWAVAAQVDTLATVVLAAQGVQEVVLLLPAAGAVGAVPA